MRKKNSEIHAFCVIFAHSHSFLASITWSVSLFVALLLVGRWGLQKRRKALHRSPKKYSNLSKEIKEAKWRSKSLKPRYCYYSCHEAALDNLSLYLFSAFCQASSRHEPMDWPSCYLVEDVSRISPWVGVSYFLMLKLYCGLLDIKVGRAGTLAQLWFCHALKSFQSPPAPPSL